MSLLATLRADLQANAPGAKGLRDVAHASLFAHGFQAVVTWRVAAHLFSKGGLLRAAGRSMSYWHAIYFGIHISPEAKIGPGLRLPHPIGVGIGRGAVLGRNVSIYQNVSIGRADLMEHAYPHLGDRVTVYAGAVVAGPIEVGDDAVVGPNAVVGSSVAPGETVVAPPGRRAALRPPGVPYPDPG